MYKDGNDKYIEENLDIVYMIGDLEIKKLKGRKIEIEKKFVEHLGNLLEMFSAIKIKNKEFRNKLMEGKKLFNKYHDSCAPGFIINSMKQYILDNMDAIYERDTKKFFGSYKKKYENDLKSAEDSNNIIVAIDSIGESIDIISEDELKEIFEALEYMVDYIIIYDK